MALDFSRPRIESRYVNALRRLGLLGAGLLCALISLAMPNPATAEALECGSSCRSAAPYILLASSSDELKREREARRLRREQLRDSESRHRKAIRGLEKQLKRAESKSREKQYRSRRSRKSNDGQAGAHCMYGVDGRLIYSPSGAECAPVKSSGTRAGTGAIAQGCAEGDCRNGQGSYIWADGSRYVGGFRNGLQHGNGSLAFVSGASYVGGWVDGKKSGMGTAILPDGRVQAGRWSNDRFLGVETMPGTTGSHASARTKKIDWPDLSRPTLEVGGGRHDAAVVVGIQRYAHVAQVPGAERNAADWYRYLVKTRGIPPERVTLLVDEDATREEMRIAAEEAAKRVGRKGHLWFIFIGHGAPAAAGEDGLLVGFDAQQKARSLKARSITRSSLIDVLEDSRAKRINLLLDACFSGRSSSGEVLVAGLQPLVVTSNAPTSDARTTLMTAAASDEYAGPLPGLSRPAFSYLVLGGLRGWGDLDEDGSIEAGELHDYVSNAMRALIRGRRQTPTLVGDEGRTLASSAKEEGPDLSEIVLDLNAPAKRQ